MKKIIFLLLGLLLVLSAASIVADSELNELYVGTKLIGGHYVEQGELLQVSVYLKTVQGGFERAHIMAFVDDMPVRAIEGPFDVDSKNANKMLYLYMPHDAKKGIHYLRIMVYGRDGTRVIYRPFYII